ncbi:MAG: hypothetical protein N2C13_02955 [Chloroflexota bacterium]
MQQPQILLTFSDNLYRRFLRVYPVEYRAGFSDEMAQVFRDLCREVYEQKGLAGFLGLWLSTMFDLIKTALEERLKETTNMTREKFVRLSGWALMFSGATLMLGFLASNNDAAYFDSPTDPLAEYNFVFDPIGGSDILYEITPIILTLSGMLFYAIGMNGLRLRFGKGSGSIGNISLQISALAGAVGFIAIIPMFVLGIDMWWNIWAYSLMLMFTGLSVFGIIAIQKKHLPRWNALPLLVGIWFPIVFLAELLGFSFEDTDIFWNIVPWIEVVGAIALGYLLQSDTGKELVTA